MGRMELSDFPTSIRADAVSVLGDGIRVAIAQPMLLGESPFWHPTEGCLYGCDIPAKQVWRWAPERDELTLWDFASEPGCVAPIEGGGLLVALRDGLWRFDPISGERVQLVASPFDTATERFNDGKCDAHGRLWVGTVYEPRKPALAALYAWDGRELMRKADGITVSNGLAWSPDGSVMYWSDTTSHTIYAWDYDPTTGSISHQRIWAQFALKTDSALEPVHDLGASSVSSGWDEMQGTNRAHRLGYDEDLQRSRSPQAGDNRPANEIVNRLMRKRRVAPKFSHPPRGAWSKATGLGALLTDGYGGRPDGAAVDTEGCYWVAMFEGQRLLRLSPQGEVLREIRLPVRCPTMPCFGGHDLQTLYITTARNNRPEAELATQPLAGCVLSVRVDVPGLPVCFARM
jgi:sugar lactone lactonase YvrE